MPVPFHGSNFHHDRAVKAALPGRPGAREGAAAMPMLMLATDTQASEYREEEK
jgi:hypothetical protein